MSAKPGRSPLRLRTRLLFAAIAFAFAVVVAEFAVRALMPAGRLLSPTAVELFHERARSEADMIQADPELGHVPVLGGKVYDKFGLLRRWGPRGSVVAKRPGVHRVLFLGDSVTRRATIAAPLRECWRRCGGEVELLNAGVESWNPVQEVEFYFRHQKALAPDHVVLWLHNNDLSESTVSCFHDGEFKLCNPGSLVALDPEWYGRSILYQLWVHSRHTDRLAPEHYTFRAAEVEAAIARLRDEVIGRGARLTVAQLPIFAAEADWLPHERRSRELAIAMLGRLEVEHFDLQPVCEELVTLGLPVRDQPTDPYHTDDVAGAVFAAAAAERLGVTAVVQVHATPRRVGRDEEQKLVIDAGKKFGGRKFLVLGSLVGVTPVTNLPRGEVPLADDSYLRATAAVDEPRFTGQLDPSGRAEVAIPVPVGVASAAIVWHCAVVADRRGIHYEAVGWPVPMLVRE
ncbi:MAG: hypothetical protein NXI31_03205 [bacterium]|nr:hypothetical protein [bacterium]